MHGSVERWLTQRVPNDSQAIASEQGAKGCEEDDLVKCERE